MKYLDEDLIKIKYIYKTDKNNNLEIKIISTNEMLKNLNNKDIEQYFMDSTYKIIPNVGDYKSLITLLGYNNKLNTFVQCCYALITEETQEIYKQFLILLKINYSFEPKYITLDFSKAEENAVLEVYKNTEIIFCFFHLVKCWWNKLNKLGLRKKNYINISKSLVFNLKLLAFISIDEVESYYEDIKNSNLYNDQKYSDFFKYVDKQWISNNNFIKWNYHSVLSDLKKSNNDSYNVGKNDFDRVILLTNNACETLHSYIRQMISHNTTVNVRVFINIICNLISKNNFDSNNKRNSKNINKKHCFNLMKKKFSTFLFQLANINNKSKVYNYDEIKDLIGDDLNEEEFLINET